MIRIVADTSVIVSGTLWSGLAHRMIELIEAGSVTACVTPSIVHEYREVLVRPKFTRKLTERMTTADEVMQALLPHVELYPDLPLSGVVKADPDDDLFVACAVASGAQYLVSGDSHLLDMAAYQSVKIVTVRQFLAEEFPDRLTPA